MRNDVQPRTCAPFFLPRYNLTQSLHDCELSTLQVSYLTVIAYQSKSNGIASGPTFALSTFLNSSYEIVPDSSLQHNTQNRNVFGLHDIARAG